MGGNDDDGPRGSVNVPLLSPSEKAADSFCFTTFASVGLMTVGFAILVVYSVWESAPVVRMHSFEYFILCVLGGILSGLPHTMLVPVDLIKCRVQVGEYSNMRQGVLGIWKEGATLPLQLRLRQYFRGWAPTFIGYSQQGAFKFGFYELFKYLLMHKVVSTEVGVEYRVWIHLISSASAEFFGDIALAPWEAVKIKMQTTRQYVPRLGIVLPRMWAIEGLNAFFKGLPPLWLRQIPYTMVKFTTFEKIAELIYIYVVRQPKSACSPTEQLFVSLAAGALAGVFCAIVSHPADTVVSRLNQRADITLFAFVRNMRFCDLWAGLGVRLVMIGALTAVQWLIYDSFKVIVGLPTTGGSVLPQNIRSATS